MFVRIPKGGVVLKRDWHRVGAVTPHQQQPWQALWWTPVAILPLPIWIPQMVRSTTSKMRVVSFTLSSSVKYLCSWAICFKLWHARWVFVLKKNRIYNLHEQNGQYMIIHMPKPVVWHAHIKIFFFHHDEYCDVTERKLRSHFPSLQCCKAE